MSERVLVGAGVGAGVAIANAFIYKTHRYVPWDIELAGTSRGLLAIKDALAAVTKDIQEVSSKSDPEAKEILEAMLLILKDSSLLEEIKLRLADGANSKRAVLGAFSAAAKELQTLGQYFSERAADVNELGEKVIAKLIGETEETWPNEPFVLVSENIGPIDFSKLVGTQIKGIVLSSSSPTSHTAILARAANLPCVVSVVGAELISAGVELIVDSSSGQVLVEPDEIELEQYQKSLTIKHTKIDMSKIKNLPVALYANLGSSSESAAAKSFGASGVGLFRTELLFLGEKQAPSFEAQVLEYSRLLAEFPNQVVIVRVLDLDTDKPLPFLKPVGGGKYANRGFEALLANPEVLSTQLRALAEAHKAYPLAKLWVMAPMVSTATQAKEFVKVAKSAGLKTVGVMVEVPEVCEETTLDTILQQVDFVSIGTNDLTQYTLSRNRLSSPTQVSEVRNPEVMDLIERVTRTAKKYNKPVGICGEAASDPESARMFIDLGVTSLSASPALLPGLISQISS